MISADQARIMTKSAKLKNIELKIKDATQSGARSVEVFIERDYAERDEIIKRIQEHGYVVRDAQTDPLKGLNVYVPTGYVAGDVIIIDWR